LLGEARLGVAFAAMVMVLTDPSNPSFHAQLGVLLSYVAYAAVLMLWADGESAGTAWKHAHWVDAACYLLVVGLEGGITSTLFLFLLFPILVASLQAGLLRGVIVAFACVLSFAGIGAFRAWLDPALRLWDLSLWPIAVLLLMGLLAVRWGNAGFAVWRRLAFLNDLNALSNPRSTRYHATKMLAEMVRAHYRADACIAIVTDAQSDGYLLLDTSVERQNARIQGERISKELVEPLLGPSPELAIVYRRRRLWQRTAAGAYDRATLDPRPADRAGLDQIANLLETDSFITMPVYCRYRPIGRLYVTSRRLRYVQSDLRFLQQIIAQAGPMIENFDLLDRLTSNVALQERRKISRDLHDGTIQPYIGLKMGLEALRRGIPDGTPLAVEVDDLTRMAGEGITELRRYVAGLRKQGQKTNGESLAAAVRCQADKFTEFYGIPVQVVAEGDLELREPLLQEVMNIVREGLANIRRHTSAMRASVSLREQGDRLVVKFVNDAPRGAHACRAFVPRSLNERARELGGRVDVERREDGWTSVAVEIPV
jgi:signal transduction histidine kinase